MPTNDTVAVVIPVYAVSSYIQHCINSVMNQTYVRLQAVLVDDGSADESGLICDKNAMDDSRVVVIHQRNGGLSAARNSGIDLVLAYGACNWITFVDSDDWIAPEYVERLLRLAIDNRTKCSMCGYAMANEEDARLETTAGEDYVTAPDNLYRRDSLKSEHFYVMTAWGKLFHTSLINEIRFPVGRLHEDEFTTHRLTFQNDVVAVTTTELYAYRQSPDSIMHAAWTPKRMDVLDAYEDQLRFFTERKCANAYTKTCISYVTVLNRYLEQIGSEPKYLQYRSQMRNMLRYRIGEAHRLGLIGNIVQEPNFYYQLHPIMFKVITKLLIIPRALKSREYRAHYREKVGRLLHLQR